MLLMWGAYSSFALMLKELTNEFQGGRAQIAGAHALSAFFVGLLSAPAGHFSDRYGPRFLVRLGALLIAVGYIAVASAQALWVFYVCLGLVVGTGLSATYVPLTSTIARYEHRSQGRLIGLVVAGAGLGGMLGPLLTAPLIQVLGWRGTYLVIGSAVAIGGILCSMFLPTMGPTGNVNKGSWKVGTVIAFRTPRFWGLSAAWLIHGFVLMGVTAHLGAHAVDLGASPGIAATILATLGIAGTVGSLTMGSVADSMGSWATFALGFASALIGLVVLGTTESIRVLYLAAIAIGISNYGIASVLPMITRDLMGGSSLGAQLGLLELSWAIGALMGPIVMGLSFDNTGTYSEGFGWSLGLIVLALAISPLYRPSRRAFL